MGLDIVAEFEQVIVALSEGGVDYAVCGGFAVNLHGHVRATRDIDILIASQDLDRARERLRGVGFSSEGASESRRPPVPISSP